MNLNSTSTKVPKGCVESDRIYRSIFPNNILISTRERVKASYILTPLIKIAQVLVFMQANSFLQY